MATDIDGDWDPQDVAEAFDEDNVSLDGAGDSSADMLTLEEMPDVLDVTSAVGDADDDDALIGEDLDDEEIIALEADGDATDIEDDDLATRMPEAFDDDVVGIEDIEELPVDGEMGLDVRDPEDLDDNEVSGEMAAAAVSADEAELDYVDDVDAETGVDEKDSAVAESDRLDDDDLEVLGYPGDDTPKRAHEGQPDQNSQ